MQTLDEEILEWTSYNSNKKSKHSSENVMNIVEHRSRIRILRILKFYHKSRILKMSY